jgi:hypothetical protein
MMVRYTPKKNIFAASPFDFSAEDCHLQVEEHRCMHCHQTMRFAVMEDHVDWRSKHEELWKLTDGMFADILSVCDEAGKMFNAPIREYVLAEMQTRRAEMLATIQALKQKYGVKE